MRIIGRTRDYYDSALAHGADMTLVYERAERTLDGVADGLGEALDIATAPFRDGFQEHVEGRWVSHERFMPRVLLFCGKAFPFYDHEHYWRPVDGRKSTLLWSAEEVEAAVEASLSGISRRRWDDMHGSFGSGRPFSRSNVREWFAGEVGDARAAEIHHRHGCPVILFRMVRDDRKVETVLDPSLKELGFAKRRDPFSAFQEIAMYLGGVLRTNERPMVEISDKVRAEKHGMDRTSFRRPAQGAR